MGKEAGQAKLRALLKSSSRVHPADRQHPTYRPRRGHRRLHAEGNNHERLYSLSSSIHQKPSNTEATETKISHSPDPSSTWNLPEPERPENTTLQFRAAKAEIHSLCLFKVFISI